MNGYCVTFVVIASPPASDTQPAAQFPPAGCRGLDYSNAIAFFEALSQSADDSGYKDVYGKESLRPE
jgi:hypothetical protein